MDCLHLPGRPALETVGGAGLYTALAIAAAGGRATLFAPRPAPLPDAFVPALAATAASLTWVGPVVPAAAVPRLEIAHHGGGRATLLGASWGGEAQLHPDDLPADLGRFAAIHIAALSSATRQATCLAACRARGARRLSVGTYARVCQAERSTVLGLVAAADDAFMNENEARLLFGEATPERVVTRAGLARRTTFITRGERGALAFSEGRVWSVPASAAVEVDPTGAGDAFCGAALLARVCGESAADAAEVGVRLAARIISQPGPSALLAQR